MACEGAAKAALVDANLPDKVYFGHQPACDAQRMRSNGRGNFSMIACTDRRRKVK
jgi:hypothetical protein